MAGVLGSHWAARHEGVQGSGIVSSPCGFWNGVGASASMPLPPCLTHPGWVAVLQISGNFETLPEPVWVERKGNQVQNRI